MDDTLPDDPADDFSPEELRAQLEQARRDVANAREEIGTLTDNVRRLRAENGELRLAAAAVLSDAPAPPGARHNVAAMPSRAARLV